MASIFSIVLAGGEGKRLAPLTAHQACREQRRSSSASNTSATGDIPGARESPTSGCVPMRGSRPRIRGRAGIVTVHAAVAASVPEAVTGCHLAGGELMAASPKEQPRRPC